MMRQWAFGVKNLLMKGRIFSSPFCPYDRVPVKEATPGVSCKNSDG